MRTLVHPGRVVRDQVPIECACSETAQDADPGSDDYVAERAVSMIGRAEYKRCQPPPA